MASPKEKIEPTFFNYADFSAKYDLTDLVEAETDFGKIKLNPSGIYGCDSSGNFSPVMKVSSNGLNIVTRSDGSALGVLINGAPLETIIALLIHDRLVPALSNWFSFNGNNVTVKGNLDVQGDATLEKSLTVEQSCDFKDKVHVEGDLSVDGTTEMNGDLIEAKVNAP